MRAGLVAVALLCAVVLFPGLDGIGAVDRREARDLRVAAELIGGREALTPTLGHEALYEKPIFAYAPDVGAHLLAGRPEPASRAWRAVAAAILVLLTGSIGAQHLGARAGVAAAGVLASTLALPVAARADGTQILATVLGWVGAAGFADAWFGRAAGRGSRLVVAWGSLAATFVIAGPLTAAWPLAGAAAFLALARRRGHRGRLHALAGLAVVAVFALPWYGAMIARHSAAFLAHAAFFPYGVEPRGGWLAGPLVAVSFAVVGFYPWVTVLPGAMVHAAARWRAPAAAAAGAEGHLAPMARDLSESTASHYFLACALAALLPVALYPTPPLTAALPALPAFALLCGRFLDHVLEDPARVAPAMARGFVLLALTGTVAGVMFLLLGQRLKDVGPEARLLGTALFATAWLPLLAHLGRRPRLAVLLVALPIAVCAPIVHLRTLPAAEGWLGTRPAARAANHLVPPGAPIALIEEPPPSFRFYVERRLVTAAAAAAAIDAARGAGGGAFVAYRPGRRSEVAAAAGVEPQDLARTPTLVLARVGPRAPAAPPGLPPR
jgi:4-amino-4-deoxy-L-arabinose transferase-like glycosyltransferase